MEQQDVAKKLPKEGALLGYQFQVSSAGNYEVWSRIGWEGIRSPFDWRVDQGPWRSVQPDYPTTDHVELAFWCPLGWMKLGQTDLTAGKHSLEFRISAWSKKENGKEVSQGIMFACDATCLTRGPFRPNGKHRPAEKVFAPQSLVVAAGKEEVVRLAEPWANPKLWWPDDPQMYHVVTRVLLGGKVVDVRRTPFGFRQWEWDSPQFKLNGLPWNLRGDSGAGVDGLNNGTLEESFAYWRDANQNHCRYWNPLGNGGLEKSKVLDVLDAHGMIVRRDGIMDGMGCNYLGNLGGNEALFDNWIPQLQAMVKEERNHPSIFAWSMENELTLINARNFGLLKQVEPRITRAAKAVMAMDPTRPAMIDGGNCLSIQSLPVNGSHYIESSITAPGIPLRDYPDQAYTWEKIVENEKQVFPLALDRPILMGECFFMTGYTCGELAQLGGEGCFAGAGPYTQRGGGLFTKMMTEGFRWHGIAGWQFSLGGGQAGNMHFNSQKPVALFCRQWNWTLGGGNEVPRTLKLFNDTRFTDPIETAWRSSTATWRRGARW
jgi:beta-galactosidase